MKFKSGNVFVDAKIRKILRNRLGLLYCPKATTGQCYISNYPSDQILHFLVS